MKLIFNKDKNNEVTVKIQQGTVAVDFTYIEMIKQLLENNEIEEPDFNNISDKEKGSLEGMLKKISKIFEEDEVDDDANIDIFDEGDSKDLL